MSGIRNIDWTTGDLRPTTIEDMALYPELKEMLSFYEETGEFGHLIMVGDVGTGKTTAALILAKSAGMSLIEYNCAKDNTATTFKKIEKETSSVTLFGTRRVFVLDEFHHTDKDVQTILNKCMEDRKSHNRFIFCVNDYTKISAPIRSRCFKHSFDVGMISQKDNTFKLHPHVGSLDVEGWKSELRRIGKRVSKNAGYEAPDEVISKVLTNPLYLTDARSFLIALELQTKMYARKH